MSALRLVSESKSGRLYFHLVVITYMLGYLWNMFELWGI
jgi:hypothetical protein